MRDVSTAPVVRAISETSCGGIKLQIRGEMLSLDRVGSIVVFFIPASRQSQNIEPTLFCSNGGMAVSAVQKSCFMKIDPIPSFARLRRLCLPWFTCLLPFSLLANPGGPDSSFAQRGSFNGPLYAVAVDGLTNIWIGGRFTQAFGQPCNGLVVLNGDGSLNTGFNPAVFGTILDEVHALAVDGFNNVYIGSKNGITRFNYNTGGSAWSLDSSFSANASAYINQVTSLAIDTTPGGFSLWAAGNAHYTNGIGVVVRNLARLTLAGTLESGFIVPAGLADQGVLQVRFVPPGIIGTNSAGFDHLIIAGVSGFTGILDPIGANATLFFDPSGYASCIAERPNTLAGCTSSPNGDIVAGGFFAPAFDFNQSDQGNNLWLNRFGGSDPTYFHNISHNNFPADQGQFVSAIEAFEGGDVLIAGVFTRLGGIVVNNFAHLLPNGQVDTAFQNNVSFFPTAMTQQPDGKIVIVGESNFTPVTGQITRRLPMDAPRAVTFTIPPTDKTIYVYVGEGFCLQAAVDGWPPPPLSWVRNGSVLTNQTTTSMCINNATSGDDGDYKLRAYLFCGGPDSVDSTSAHVTVLPAPPPPANDLLSNALVLTGSQPVATGTLRSSTLEAGEPNHAENANGRSVWWQWTAPSNGVAFLDVSDCDFPAALGVYTGTSADGLTRVKDNCLLVDDGEGGLYCRVAPWVSFTVLAGTTYKIAIGGTPEIGSLGNIVLRLGYRLASWSQSVSGTTNSLYGVAAGNGHIVAGGYPATILVSTNGTQWTPGNSGISPDTSINGVSYDKGLFLALADSGTIATSTNGTNWASQTTGVSVSDYLYSAVFGNGRFAAVADEGIIITSPDGTNWTRRATGIGVHAFDSLYSIAYGNGLFATVGDEGTIVTSPDGTTWTLQASGLSTSYSLYGIAFGNGQFVAVGDQGKIVTSTDGTNWTPATSGVSAYLYAVAHRNGRFVAVGEGGTIILSTDGINWVQDISGVTVDLYGVCYHQNSQFVIVGDLGTILMNQFPQLGPATLLLNGTIQFGLIGLSGATAIIEATPTLSPPDWQPISTNTIVNGTAIITTSRTNLSSRYYRAKVQ